MPGTVRTMTPSTSSSYAIEAEIVGTVVERTPRDQAGPSGWMVRCICGYKAGPYAAGLVQHANEIRDQHEAECLWPKAAS